MRLGEEAGIPEAFTPNVLISALEQGDFALISPHLVRVDVKPAQVLLERNKPIEHLYFLESGVASLVCSPGGEDRTEVGIMGREGVTGYPVILGTDRVPHETFIQVNCGTALRIDADDMRRAVAASGTFRALLLRYVQTLLVQTAHTACSNARHGLEVRLSRWLLMCHDRVDGDDFEITHEFLAIMIAAHRTGVTTGLNYLERAGMIRSKRGCVAVVDRDELERFAGSSYGEPEAEYRRLVAPIGKGRFAR